MNLLVNVSYDQYHICCNNFHFGKCNTHFVSALIQNRRHLTAQTFPNGVSAMFQVTLFWRWCGELDVFNADYDNILGSF